MTGGNIGDGGYVLEFLLKCCVQSVCIESVFHREHYRDEQKASGIHVEISELDSWLEEILEREKDGKANIESQDLDKNKKAEKEKATAEEVRKQAMERMADTKKRENVWRTIPAKIHVLYLQHNILNLTQNFCISNSTFKFNTRLLYLQHDNSNLIQDFCISNSTFEFNTRLLLFSRTSSNFNLSPLLDLSYSYFKHRF